MKIKSLILSSLAFCAFTASTAMAEPDFSYNYIEASYAWTHLDDSDLNDANGVLAYASWSPIPYFFLEAGYDYMNSGLVATNTGVNSDGFLYGGGAYYGITDNMDIVGHVGGYHTDVRYNTFGDESNDAVYVGMSLRIAATKEIEVEPSIEYSHFKQSDADWTYGVKGLYAITPDVGGLVGVAMNDESDLRLTVGARLTWGCQ